MEQRPERTVRTETGELRHFAGGDVYLWIEDGGSIHLKAVTRHGDPTELTAEMARELAAALSTAAERLDGP